mmetsp:Transcript_1123/g.2330  ORF Transcript_1123/g.2330 Transcript_1123/m.2330 type:complete len:200 (-) Transcript_1123:1739-2338(-)
MLLCAAGAASELLSGKGCPQMLGVAEAQLEGAPAGETNPLESQHLAPRERPLQGRRLLRSALQHPGHHVGQPPRRELRRVPVHGPCRGRRADVIGIDHLHHQLIPRVIVDVGPHCHPAARAIQEPTGTVHCHINGGALLHPATQLHHQRLIRTQGIGILGVVAAVVPVTEAVLPEAGRVQRALLEALVPHQGPLYVSQV